MAEKGILLIVGLGNPGRQYEETRHNAGFWFVDLLASRFGGVLRPDNKFFGDTCRIHTGNRECWLLEPQTYMNRSGASVASLSKYYKISPEQILVAHDELDLPAGTVRLKRGGGHAGHNGLRDVISALGTRDFWRLRVGVGHPGEKQAVVDYVLSRPSRGEHGEIMCGLNRADGLFADMLQGEMQRAMNQLH